ncbi:MAG: glycosyltransferase family 2 protein [Smithella sp.]
MRSIFSIVVPVYQNAKNLYQNVPKLLTLKDMLPVYELELIFVDDGSSDGSFDILKSFVAKNPEHIKIIKLARNFGQTPAIQAGLRYAHGQCVGIISADLQEPYELFVDMLKKWEEGAKFVMGERCHREEHKRHQMISSIYWTLVRRFALPDFPKMGYDFCLIDRQVVDNINQINEKNSSVFVLIYWLGYRPVRIPIIRSLRNEGESQWHLWKKINFTIDTIFNFTLLPARLITFSGITMACFCFLYFLRMFILWFLYHETPPGWMSVIGLLSMFGALLLFSIGIVSEYLLRILDESRKRPPYVVEDVIKIEANEKR